MMPSDNHINAASLEALEEAQKLYSGAGLPFPPIPPYLADRVVELDRWVYGTRSDHPFIYDIDWFTEEAFGQSPADYVLFGHSGHGVNSWAIHYYHLHGPLALFVQVGWGGAYATPQDNTNSAALLERLQADGRALSDAIDNAAQKGKLVAGERFIVVASTFYGGQWLHVNHTVSHDVQPWQQSQPETVIRAAIAALQAL